MQTQQAQSNTVPASVFALWREVDKLGLSTREIVENMLAEEKDFEIDDYRFVHDSVIAETLKDYLGNDDYMLGCFTDWFLADVLEIDLDVIQAMQKAEAFEAIGKLVVSMGKLDELAEQAASYDGYGLFLAPYDGEDQEIGGYHVFRQN